GGPGKAGTIGASGNKNKGNPQGAGSNSPTFVTTAVRKAIRRVTIRGVESQPAAAQPRNPRRHMLRFLSVALLAVAAATQAHAYIEATHTLGRCVHESNNVVLVELTRVNQEKGLLIYKKIADIKGKFPTDEIKHNIGKRGFHEREWKNVMAWAEAGKRAVFFCNNEANESCI